MENHLSEKAPTPTSEETSKKLILARKIGNFVKGRVNHYIHNLNPIGKDKFWWTGNLLSASGTAAIFYFAPGARVIKSLSSASLSVGLYASEKAMERHRLNHWTEEQRMAHAAKRQEKFPNGTSRLKRFLLGASAGSFYGAAFGLSIETIRKEQMLHSVKNIQPHTKIT